MLSLALSLGFAIVTVSADAPPNPQSSKLFARLNSTACAERLPYGNLAVGTGGTTNGQFDAYLSTLGSNTLHSMWMQVVMNGGEELFRIFYHFKSTKTVAERFANAVANGEAVDFEVYHTQNNNAYYSYRGVTWRFSSSSGITVSSFSDSGTRLFSLDDGVWGAGSFTLDGNIHFSDRLPGDFWGVGVWNTLSSEAVQCSKVYVKGQPIEYPNAKTLLYTGMMSPTRAPTAMPSVSPTRSPSYSPTIRPTPAPSEKPTISPSAAPSIRPTLSPSASPSRSPTAEPSYSMAPSESPTIRPTPTPTMAPSREPSQGPTMKPSQRPTSRPTSSPTRPPTPYYCAESSLNIPSSCGLENCPRGLNMMIRGYDTISGSFRGIILDPPILSAAYLWGKYYDVPDPSMMRVQEISRIETSESSASYFSKATDYRSFLTSANGLQSMWRKYYPTYYREASFLNTMLDSVGARTSTVASVVRSVSKAKYYGQLEMTTTAYTMANIAPSQGLFCNSIFFNALKALPKTYSPATYQNFVATYGNTFVVEANFGGKVSSSVEVESCTYSQSRALQSAVSFRTFVMSGKQQSLEVFDATIQKSRLTIEGGHADVMLVGNWSGYANSVKSNSFPVVTTGRLALLPLYELASDPDVKRNLERAVFEDARSRNVASYWNDNVNSTCAGTNALWFLV